MVEIVRAVSQNSRMVIMDEPTSSLSDHEVQALFKVMRKLKSENVAIIYISHRLKEILEMGDTLTVLRDGTLVDTVPVSEVTEDKMVAMILLSPWGRHMQLGHIIHIVQNVTVHVVKAKAEKVIL